LAGIFRAYDIRGVYPTELNEGVARRIGFAFAKMNRGKIVVGGDVRLSTPKLKAAFIEGARAAGASVIDVGFVTTPLLGWTARALGAAGSAAITASHNPKEWNGIKLNDKKGPISYESGLKKIEKELSAMATNGNKMVNKMGSREGQLTQKDPLPEYVRFIDNYVHHHGAFSRLKVVVDAGNGVTGMINPPVLQMLGADVIKLFCEPDGNFPNHEPNPEKPENLSALQEKVLEEKANLGIAYDGDGDRVGFVDEKGRIVAESKVFCILIRDALSKEKGKVIFDVKCSKAIQETIRKEGGEPVMSRTGHTYITQKMKEIGAVLAGERSGHYYFRELGGNDDALFATIKVLQYLIKTGKELSSISNDFPQYFSAHERLSIDEKRKFQLVEDIGKEFEKFGAVSRIDGARVELKEGWMLSRASNTEGKIDVIYEGTTKKAFSDIKKKVDEVLQRVGVRQA